MGTRVRYDSPSTAALLGKPGLVGGTRADVVVLDVGDLDVRLGVVLHECLHNGGVVLLVLHEPLHLGAVLQLGQRRPQDLDPRRGEHNVRSVVVLQHPPHLHGEVLGLVPLPGVGLLVLHGVLHVHGVPLLVAELQFGGAQGWNLPLRIELVLDLKLLHLLDRHSFMSA